VIYFKSQQNKKLKIWGNVLSAAEKGLSDKLFCQKARLPNAFSYFIHKLSKHDHVIYGATKGQSSRKTN